MRGSNQRPAFVTSIYVATVTVAATAFAFGESPEPRAWFDLRRDPQANFYSIQREYRRHAQEEADRVPDANALTKITAGWGMAAGSENEAAEEDGETQFRRWESFMEPRVYPSGDLSLPARAFSAMSPYLGLDGRHRSEMAGDWKPLGPTRTRNDQGGMGRMNFIRFHPRNPDILYAGSPGGGLWVSPNGGSSWSTVTDAMAVLGVADLAIDPIEPDIMYLATGDGNSVDAACIGVLKSYDGGLTWGATGLSWRPDERKQAHRLLINPKNSQVLLLGATDGVYRTTDAGITWSHVLSIDSLETGSEPHDQWGLMDLAFKANDPNVVFAGGKYLYRSANGGLSFTRVVGIPKAYKVIPSVTAANPSLVFALSTNERTFRSLMASSDGGLTFTQRSNAPNIMGREKDGSDTDGQSYYNLTMAVSPTNPDLIFVGGIEAWKSQDGGRTWKNTHGDMHTDVHDLQFVPGSPATIYMAQDAGVFKSTDLGATWNDRSNGLGIAQIYHLGQSPFDPARILTGMQDNGTNLFDNGAWTHPYGGDGMECFFDWSNPSAYFAGVQMGRIFRTIDDGKTWKEMTPANHEGPWNTAWLQDPKDARILYWADTEIWKSSNLGDLWNRLAPLSGIKPVRNIVIDPGNTKILYVVKEDALAKSINGGTSWASIKGNLPAQDAGLMDLAIDPADANGLWVCFSGYQEGAKVWRSRNAGVTWSDWSQGLPNLPVNDIVAQKGTNGAVYAATDLGVFYRDNSMPAWIAFFGGLPNVGVMELEFSYAATPEKTLLRAATYGRGLWESAPYNGLPVVAARAAARPAFRDFSAAPGHGGRTASVRFFAMRPGRYRVDVLDAGGRRLGGRELEGFSGAYAGEIELDGRGGGGIGLVRLGDGRAQSVRTIFLAP